MQLNSRLFREARQSRLTLILSIVFGLAGGILAILQAREISRVIDQVFLQGKDFSSTSGIFLLILGIILLRACAIWASELSANAGARRIKESLRQRLYTHIVDIGPAYLRGEAGESQPSTGELANLAIEGADAIEVYYSQYIPQLALAALIPTTILFFVFPSDLLTGIVLLVTAPLLPIFMYLIGTTAENLTKRQWRGLSRMSAYFLDILQGLTTLKSLGRSKEQVEVIKRVSESYRKTTMSVLKVTFLSALALELIATLSTAVVAVEIGIRLLYGRIAFEQAFFVLLLAPEFYLPLRMLGTRFHAGMAGVQAARRIFEILDLRATETLARPTNQLLYNNSTPPIIEFKQVGFAYSDQRTALKDISFTIPAGKITALVGESGAGKTTLTWLLLRFLQPQHGEILINGKPMAEIPPQVWRDSLAWVPQNPYLFNNTIEANIKLARPDATLADIQRAATLAHADEFIARFPNGYATVIGERGTRLSAGQGQRIALARAFLKDAPLLILDEATSHLDPESDALLRESLQHLSMGRTVLVIAHHRQTLSAADQVVTLTRGDIKQVQSQVTSRAPLNEPVNITASQPVAHLPANKDRQNKPSTKIKKRQTLALDWRLIKLLSPFAGRVLLSIFLGFGTIASSVGLMATAAYVISAAALHPSIAELQVAIVGVRFFGLSRGVFRYLERLVSHDLTLRLLARWRVWFYQALERLAPARLMQYHSGDLLARVINDIGTLESFYVRGIFPPLVALLVSITVIIFMGVFDASFAGALLVFILLTEFGLPALTFLLSRKLGNQVIQARASLSTILIDGIQGLPDLLTSGKPQIQIERVKQTGLRLTKLQSQMANLAALQNATGSLSANLAMLSVMVLAVQFVSIGNLNGVLIGVLALAALTSFEAVLPLPLAAQNLEINRSAAQRLYELVDSAPAVINPPQSLALPSVTHLEVQQLSFRYPLWVDGDRTANPAFSLKDISFSLPQGKHIAILGASGAGKTTIINLLQRFWEYQGGFIQLNGVELRDYSADDIRKRIAVISQSTYLFSATIRENLLIARPDATQEDLIHTVRAAQLSELIQSLPEGYNTWIGEHGFRLSAGERQRVSIARALLKNAPLVILDEPTANLDPSTERALLSSIQELCRGRSMINITQRMAGLEVMDEILVLKDGQVSERGTHDVLIACGGMYHRMWSLYNQIV